ncbi:hypothetical protein C8R45DRAFT_1026889 [Mycena sanguinolenta]|nr:hypothetical protein C8R45DRAFT_1026889 [Mycena sanguinolenta]
MRAVGWSFLLPCSFSVNSNLFWLAILLVRYGENGRMCRSNRAQGAAEPERDLRSEMAFTSANMRVKKRGHQIMSFGTALKLEKISV